MINYNDLYYRKIYFDTTSQSMIYDYYKFNTDNLGDFAFKPVNLFKKNDKGEFEFVKVFTFEKYRDELSQPEPTPTTEDTLNEMVKVDKELIINPDGENYINVYVNMSKEELLKLKELQNG